MNVIRGELEEQGDGGADYSRALLCGPGGRDQIAPSDETARHFTNMLDPSSWNYHQIRTFAARTFPPVNPECSVPDSGASGAGDVARKGSNAHTQAVGVPAPVM